MSRGDDDYKIVFKSHVLIIRDRQPPRIGEQHRKLPISDVLVIDMGSLGA